MTMRTVLVWSLGLLLASAGEPPFDELLSEIRTGNTYQRQRAVSQLASTGDPRVAGILVDLLRDKDAGEMVRIGAAQELVTLADPTTADALAEALSDEDDRVRQYAAEGLLTIGSERHVPALVAFVTEHLRSSLNSLAYQAAFEAIGQLATTAPPEFVAMIDKISEEGDSEGPFRWWLETQVARCLGQIGDRQALATLRKARATLESGHQDYRTWYAVCEAMASIDPDGFPFHRPAADILDGIEWGKGGAYGEQPLAELGEEAMADLKWVLKFDGARDRDRVSDALRALGAIGGQEAADLLRHYIADRVAQPEGTSPSALHLNSDALYLLLQAMPTETITDEVFSLAHHFSDTQQRSLVSTVPDLPSTRVPREIKWRFLKQVILGSDQAKPLGLAARVAAIGRLEIGGGQESGRVLSDILPKSSDDREAIAITETLKRTRDYDAVPTLIEAAHWENVPKDAVAYALGHIGDERAIPILRDMMRRDDVPGQGRLWGAAALARLGVDYDENARLIRDALPDSLDQARWLHDKETVAAIAKLIGDAAVPAERYRRASRFPTAYSRMSLLDQHVVSVLQSIGTEDVLEVLATQIDLQNISDLDQVRRLSSAAAQIAERLDHEDREHWINIASLARVVGGSVGRVTMTQDAPRPEDRDQIPASYRSVLEKNPAVARKMWIAEVNRRLDGIPGWEGPGYVAGQAIRAAELIYSPELVPALERLLTDCDARWSMISPCGNVSYYYIRSLAAELLTEKTGRPYTFVDVDGQTHPGGWDPSRGQ